MRYFPGNKHFIFIICLTVLGACAPSKKGSEQNKAAGEVEEFFVDKTLELALEQFDLLAQKALEAQRIPRTTKGHNVHWTNEDFDWTEGFFPGTNWYFYELTKDEKWRSIAEEFQAQYEDHKLMTFNHDLGFVFNCSYGNGYRLTQNEAFKQVMIDAGNSLITRFNPKVGSIQSWDVDKGWQAKRGWQFPVIIDNMLNLELLFELTKLTGDPKYREVAILHANTALKNHFRADNSSWHVVDYDPVTGAIRGKHTAQGYSRESSWARGQAWGLYGYVVCYRYTKNPVYLKQALKIADFIMADKRIEADKIPYWDYDAPNIPDEPRDASAAAITASALIELSDYADKKYWDYATEVLKSLSSPAYFAKKRANNNFILKHSVGSIPHNNEIDVPLNYADYYFVEALLRYKKKSANTGQTSNQASEHPLHPLYRESGVNTMSNISAYWTNYLASRRTGTDLFDPDSPMDSRFIPNNFSYAGYYHSDKPLPTELELNSYREFNVNDFGAIPNDGKSDKEAIRKAMAAIRDYQKIGGQGAILFFPEGRFILNDESDMAKIDSNNKEDLKKNQVLQLSASHFVLRGSGVDETILWMKTPLIPENPQQKWSTPYLLQLGVQEMKSSRVTKITSSNKPGSTKSLLVEDPTLFKVGDYVELNGTITDAGKINAAIAPYELETDVVTKEYIWQNITNGLNKIEKHQIATIRGSELTLSAPMAHEIDATDNWTIRIINPAVEIGLENLTIAGNWNDVFEHHKDALHDSGYSLLQIKNAANSWMRNVVISDFCQGINWKNTFNLTAENITLTGVQGHLAFSFTYGNNNLTKNVTDNANTWHAPGLSKYAISNVHLRMSYSPTSTSDLHGEQSMHNLFDNTTGGWVNGRWGGALNNLPNHLHGLYYWNHNNTGKAAENFEFMQTQSNYGRLIMPHLVGLHGAPVTVQNQHFFSKKIKTSGKAHYNVLLSTDPQGYLEFSGQSVLPVSLYEAQLQYRKNLTN